MILIGRKTTRYTFSILFSALQFHDERTVQVVNVTRKRFRFPQTPDLNSDFSDPIRFGVVISVKKTTVVKKKTNHAVHTYYYYIYYIIRFARIRSRWPADPRIIVKYDCLLYSICHYRSRTWRATVAFPQIYRRRHHRLYYPPINCQTSRWNTRNKPLYRSIYIYIKIEGSFVNFNGDEGHCAISMTLKKMYVTLQNYRRDTLSYHCNRLL